MDAFGCLDLWWISSLSFVVECIREMIIMHFMGKVVDWHENVQKQWNSIKLKCAKFEK